VDLAISKVVDRSVQRKHASKRQYLFGKKFTLLDKLMMIPVANPMTRNQIMSSAEIAEDILIQFQIPLIFSQIMNQNSFWKWSGWLIKSESNPCVSSYSWSWFNFFWRASSSQIISECDLSFTLFNFLTSKENILPWWKMQYPILAAFSWQFAQLFKFSGCN